MSIHNGGKSPRDIKPTLKATAMATTTAASTVSNVKQSSDSEIISASSGTPVVVNGKESGEKTPEMKPEEKVPLIDMETFQQILDLDEEGTYEFSQGLVWQYFEQAEDTFKAMDDALEKEDLLVLSEKGHFLKGSSASFGLSRVGSGCERIQNYGKLTDESEITSAQALEKIAELLPEVKKEYSTAEAWFRNYYLKLEHDIDVLL